MKSVTWNEMKSQSASEKAIAFFIEHAGFSFHPGKETVEQGKRRGAIALAEAERKASEAGFGFEWSIDENSDSSDWTDEEPSWQVWACKCFDVNGKYLSGLYAIDLGRDGNPYSDPYRRVVEAELAMEAIG